MKKLNLLFLLLLITSFFSKNSNGQQAIFNYNTPTLILYENSIPIQKSQSIPVNPDIFNGNRAQTATINVTYVGVMDSIAKGSV